jgi:hypothetical protein
MPRCRGCNLILNEAAECCARCGAPAPSCFRVSARGISIVAIVVTISGVGLWSGGKTTQPKALPAAVSRPFVVSTEISISEGSHPTVTGTTTPPAPPVEQSIASGPLRWRDGYIDNGHFIKANWRTIEADNGAVAAVDMKSIVHDTNGHGAYAVAYIVGGDIFDPSNLRGFTFDCQGHFSVLLAASGGISPMTYGPPRSVAAQIGALACAGAPSICDVARQNGVTCN